ncbi:MAG TPA: carbohydrate-binding domain-containing protein [Planctomycetota bacterium]|nr:carbohydrate-binding domain-containing protein [Planctomycetota bacterium]
MRYGILRSLLAAAVLVGGGCQTMSGVPSAPEKPSAPSPAMAPKPSAPTPPAAPSTPPEAAAPGVTKPAIPPTAAGGTAIKADVSKIKFTVQSPDLFGWDDGESRAFFYTNGLGEVTVRVPADGDYDIVITASCQAAKGENAKFKLKVDGAQIGAETQLKSEDAKDYTFPCALKAGERKIGTEYTNDIYKEGEYDLNFFLHGVKIVRK